MHKLLLIYKEFFSPTYTYSIFYFIIYHLEYVIRNEVAKDLSPRLCLLIYDMTHSKKEITFEWS